MCLYFVTQKPGPGRFALPTVLITGANRGIGLTLARQYAADGWKVLATCRDPARAGALNAIDGDVHPLGLAVPDASSVASLPEALPPEQIHVLFKKKRKR